MLGVLLRQVLVLLLEVEQLGTDFGLAFTPSCQTDLRDQQCRQNQSRHQTDNDDDTLLDDDFAVQFVPHHLAVVFMADQCKIVFLLLQFS